MAGLTPPSSGPAYGGPLKSNVSFHTHKEDPTADQSRPIRSRRNARRLRTDSLPNVAGGPHVLWSNSVGETVQRLLRWRADSRQRSRHGVAFLDQRSACNTRRREELGHTHVPFTDCIPTDALGKRSASSISRRLAARNRHGRRKQRSSSHAHSLHEFFETVVSGDDVRQSKPAPDCYLLAIERLGLPASDCIAIEDTEHGVNAATSAGVACLAIPTNMSKHHSFSRATAVFGELRAAASWVQGHAALRQ